MTNNKYSIDVVVKYYKDGTLLPLYLVWDNQIKYKIDKIKEIKNGASLKYGLQGLRYTCQIQNQWRHLFFDGKQWFVSPID